MLKRIAYAALASSLMFASMGASADDAFPKDNSNDYGVRVAGSGEDSPFPKDNSNDYGTTMAA